jgi:hypothetical protein
MRKSFMPAALFACALLAGCGAPQPKVSTQNSNSAAGNTQTSIQHGPSTSNMGVASSHGAGDSNAAPTPAGGASKAPVDTPDLDAKIEKAEAKAKAAGAGDADKKSAAAAYFERADFYREQGMPALYKFALADYKCGLSYDANAREAREKMDEIVQIYQSMGRAVPEVSCTR